MLQALWVKPPNPKANSIRPWCRLSLCGFLSTGATEVVLVSRRKRGKRGTMGGEDGVREPDVKLNTAMRFSWLKQLFIDCDKSRDV